jgi:hypothetical protein
MRRRPTPRLRGGRSYILEFPVGTDPEHAREVAAHFDEQLRKPGQRIVGVAGVTIKEMK